MRAADTKVLALSGGVGGARMALGLQRVLSLGSLQVIVNTADDFVHLGLEISPDLDTVLYTLAGLGDPEQGWGRRGESWRVMDALSVLGGPEWFRLGDTDLGTHLYRTHRLRAGATLTQVTAELAKRCGVHAGIVPMCDAPVRTMLATEHGEQSFQHWFVKERGEPHVRAIRFDGIEASMPSSCFGAALDRADVIVIGPSNPWLSVDPILRVPGLASALRSSGRPVVGVSPIIGDRAFKGPAAAMLAWFGFEVSAFGVAHWFATRHPGLLDLWVVDEVDAALAPRIDALGLRTLVAKTHVHDPVEAGHLARALLGAIA